MFCCVYSIGVRSRVDKKEITKTFEAIQKFALFKVRTSSNSFKRRTNRQVIREIGEKWNSWYEFL